METEEVDRDDGLAAQQVHNRIAFSLEEAPTTTNSLLNQERDKHRKRAERFATEYHEPVTFGRRELQLEARRERNKREGFSTGIDVFAPEETDKRRQRAARFGATLGEEAQRDLTTTYRPSADEEAKRRRAIKFGVQYNAADAVLAHADLFEPRRDVHADEARRPEAIHMYGVDVMSTAECLAYFDEYGPTFVEWINDSACNVLFRDSLSAKRAIMGKGTPLPAAEQGTGTGLDPTDVSNLPYLWHKGQAFVKADGTEVALVLRLATGLDIKKPTDAKRSRYLWVDGPQGRGGGRGRGRGRGGYQQQYNQQQQYYDGGAVDEDGDVTMRKQHGPRGRQQRKRQNLGGGGRGDEDVDMEDAEAGEGDVDGGTWEPVNRSAGDGLLRRARISVPRPSAATEPAAASGNLFLSAASRAGLTTVSYRGSAAAAQEEGLSWPLKPAGAAGGTGSSDVAMAPAVAGHSEQDVVAVANGGGGDEGVAAAGVSGDGGTAGEAAAAGGVAGGEVPELDMAVEGGDVDAVDEAAAGDFAEILG